MWSQLKPNLTGALQHELYLRVDVTLKQELAFSIPCWLLIGCRLQGAVGGAHILPSVEPVSYG